MSDYVVPCGIAFMQGMGDCFICGKDDHICIGCKEVQRLAAEVDRLKQVLKTIKNVGDSRGGESTSFYNIARIAARALSDE